MTQQQTPRTWTLEGPMRPDGLVVIRTPDAPVSSDHERTNVVEAEPVADLLERLRDLIHPGSPPKERARGEINALLHTLRGSDA